MLANVQQAMSAASIPLVKLATLQVPASTIQVRAAVLMGTGIASPAAPLVLTDNLTPIELMYILRTHVRKI